MDRQQHSWGLLVGRLRRSRMCRELAPARRAGRGQFRVYYPATRSRKRVMVVPVPVVEMLRCMMGSNTVNGGAVKSCFLRVTRISANRLPLFARSAAHCWLISALREALGV